MLNRRIVAIAIAVALLVSWRLYQVAVGTDNFPGLYYSLAHVWIVTVGSLLALKTKAN